MYIKTAAVAESMYFHASWQAEGESQEVTPSLTLQTPLQLSDGNYEIALLEASFTPTFINVPPASKIEFFTENKRQVYEFPSSAPISTTAQLTMTIRDIIEKADLKDKVKIVKSANKDKIKWTIPKDVTLDMNPELREFLGLGNVVLNDIKSYESIPQLFPFLKRIFFQTEFISPSHYCKNKRMPILNSMLLTPEKDICNEVFVKPIFHRLNVTWLEKLRVKLTDENGKVLKMSDGQVFLLLTIKKAQF